MIIRASFGDKASASIKRRQSLSGAVSFGGVFYTSLWRPYGPAREALERGDRIAVNAYFHDNHAFHRRLFVDVSGNIVTDVGLNHILDILFVSATAQIDPFFIGLTDGTPTVAAGDTMASHAGWVEDQNYSEAVRQTFTDVRSGQSVDNSAAKGSFAIDATTTIGGAFMNSVNTKGGTTGTLLCVVAFTGGDKAVANGDTLEVQYTFSAADA